MQQTISLTPMQRIQMILVIFLYHLKNPLKESQLYLPSLKQRYEEAINYSEK